MSARQEDGEGGERQQAEEAQCVVEGGRQRRVLPAEEPPVALEEAVAVAGEIVVPQEGEWIGVRRRHRVSGGLRAEGRERRRTAGTLWGEMPGRGQQEGDPADQRPTGEGAAPRPWAAGAAAPGAREVERGGQGEGEGGGDEAVAREQPGPQEQPERGVGAPGPARAIGGRAPQDKGAGDQEQGEERDLQGEVAGGGSDEAERRPEPDERGHAEGGALPPRQRGDDERVGRGDSGGPQEDREGAQRGGVRQDVGASQGAQDERAEPVVARGIVAGDIARGVAQHLAVAPAGAGQGRPRRDDRRRVREVERALGALRDVRQLQEGVRDVALLRHEAGRAARGGGVAGQLLGVDEVGGLVGRVPERDDQAPEQALEGHGDEQEGEQSPVARRTPD